MLGLEAWSFELQTILAGRLGQTALDAHTIMLSVAGFTFISFPFGVSVAAAIRIGTLLGAQKPTRASASMQCAIGLGVGFMVRPPVCAHRHACAPSSRSPGRCAARVPAPTGARACSGRAGRVRRAHGA
eukprot:3288397-Prymnesium_polylepis.1